MRCTRCSWRQDVDSICRTCEECGSVLWVEYDLAAVRREASPRDFQGRLDGLWRYRELLPLRDRRHKISLGEGVTPLVTLPPRAHALLRFERGLLQLKDESLNPTGSFKARGMAVAISRAQELGIKRVVLPSAGNAGSAAAAYSVVADIDCEVFVPRDTPAANISELRQFNARVHLVAGSIADAAREMRLTMAASQFDLSTLREPYRLEGKKTIGLELAEQGGWGDDCLPDVIVYPTGGGTGLIGMWKAFLELQELGWIGHKLPRMVSVQAAGCAPIVRAYDEGQDVSQPWEDPRTIASGLRVPHALGDYLILQIVRSTGGTAVSVSDDSIWLARTTLARTTGIAASPEGAATWAAVAVLRDRGELTGTEHVVIFNTATGLKYPLNAESDADADKIGK